MENREGEGECGLDEDDEEVADNNSDCVVAPPCQFISET